LLLPRSARNRKYAVVHKTLVWCKLWTIFPFWAVWLREKQDVKPLQDVVLADDWHALPRGLVGRRLSGPLSSGWPSTSHDRGKKLVCPKRQGRLEHCALKSTARSGVQLIGVYVSSGGSCTLITKFHLASPLNRLAVESLQPGRDVT
jgi:hypothetical protein